MGMSQRCFFRIATRSDSITTGGISSERRLSGLGRGPREAFSPGGETDRPGFADLRGRGGAGFPTGRNGRPLADDAPFPRYIITNTDEMEPGTFKDRILVCGQSAHVIEGMILAGYAVSAERGFFFVRPSYESVRRYPRKGRRRPGRRVYLGKNILGSTIPSIRCPPERGPIHLRRDQRPVHALEGKRPHPNHRGAPHRGRALGKAHGHQQRGNPGLRAPYPEERCRVVSETWPEARPPPATRSTRQRPGQPSRLF